MSSDSELKKHAAIYARYSTDLQKERSVEDQVMLCKQRAEREGWTVRPEHVFFDRAKTSATLIDRTGILNMMKAAEDKVRGFQILICEDLDRISREPADLPYVHRHLKFCKVQIHALSMGNIDDMHVAMKGFVGQQQLKDITFKVRGRLECLVREGKIVGGAPYGYRSTAEKGKPEINPETVEIVRRIFREYLAGASPREIAAQLNREGIKAPRGEAWTYSYIQLMLANTLYAGEYIWNRTNNIRNPKTGKINHRANEAPVKIALPHLRIIDQQTWEAVQTKRRQRAYRQFGELGRVSRRSTARPFIGRNAHPIADLLRCGVCGSHMLIRSVTKGIPWVACAAAVGHGTCSHKRTYNLDTMQLGFRKATAKYLGDPRAIVEATKAYYAEWTQGRKQHRDDATSLRKQLDRVQLKISRLHMAIRDSDTPVAELLALGKPLEVERAGLTERLRLAEAESTVVELRPKAIQTFEHSIGELRKTMLSDAPLGPDAKHALAAFFDCLVVHETARRADYVVEPIVRIGALLGGVDILGIKNMSRGENGSSFSPLAQQPSTSVLPIGRWQLVA